MEDWNEIQKRSIPYHETCTEIPRCSGCPASAGTQGVPVCLFAGGGTDTGGGAVQPQGVYQRDGLVFGICVRKASGRCCQCGTGTGYVVSGAVSAPAGILVRADFLYLGRGRRGERIHFAQPYDALHRGGSHGVQHRPGYPAQLPLHQIYCHAGGCAGDFGGGTDPAVLEGPPQ